MKIQIQIFNTNTKRSSYIERRALIGVWKLTSTNQPNPHEPYSLLLYVIMIIMIVISVFLVLSSPTKIVYFSCVHFHWCESHGLLAIDLVGLLKITRPSALGKSDPFCGPSNPRYLFTKDYIIFCARGDGVRAKCRKCQG